MPISSDLAGYVRACSGLRNFFKERLSIEDAVGKVSKKCESRSEDFLDIVKKAVYENEDSPFLKLLKSANLRFSDVKSLVDSRGVEGALRELAEEGAYVRIDEFKGKSICVRNGRKFAFEESDFDNTLFHSGLEITSGATRSSGTKTMVDFNSLTESAEDFAVMQHVHNLIDTPQIVWMPTGLGMICVLRYGKLGNVPVSWFSQARWFPKIGKGNLYSSIKNRVMVDSMIYEARVMGIPLPKMKWVDIDDVREVTEKISRVIKENSRCCVTTFVSSALRACKSAVDTGTDIEGAVFLVTGEPLTPTKRREIESTGAEVIPWYAASEIGVISFGCRKPSNCDDTHFLSNRLAMIQYKREIKDFGIDVNAFLLTSLSPFARKRLINVEMGDYGVMEKLKCGCGYEKLGLEDVIYNIRSFEKLTGEGMTLIGSDMVDVLEEDLPAMFGGSSTDYQVVEAEDEHGFTHMDVLVSPSLGKVDEKRVVDAVYDGLRRRSKGRNLSFEMWEDAGTIRVRREKPIVTKRGKLFSFQINKIRKKK